MEANICRSSLIVDFAGETHRLEPRDTLDFGRRAQLVIDDNEFLHRRLGRFEYRNGFWVLCNIGRSLHVNVLDTATQTQALVAPGRDVALTFMPSVVRFRAGPTLYELLVDSEATSGIASPAPEEALDTLTFSGFPLTASQRMLVVVLAEPTLRGPGPGVPIPNSASAAARLGWTLTQFNRKLDNVCAKLTKAGVAGLHGKAGVLASNRRRVLVEFAVQSGLVTVDDLLLLDG